MRNVALQITRNRCTVGVASGRLLLTRRSASTVVFSVFHPGFTRVRGRQGFTVCACPVQRCTPDSRWLDAGKSSTWRIPSQQRCAAGVNWRCQLTCSGLMSPPRMGITPSASTADKLKLQPTGPNVRGIRHWCLRKARSESAHNAVLKSRGLNLTSCYSACLVLTGFASNVTIPASSCRGQLGSCNRWVIYYSC